MLKRATLEKRESLFFQELLCVIAITALLTSPVLRAQEARGQIGGRVTDSSPAAVAAAILTLTNLDTGVRIDTAANSGGDYLLPFLLPGRYKLSASHPGFRDYLQENIEVRVAERLTLNVKLEIGDAKQSVTVVSDSPLIESSTPTVGPVVGGRDLTELPVLNGNTSELVIVVTPGVSTTNLLLATQTSTGAGNFSVNGSPNTGNQFSIDGIANTQGGALAYTPPPDAVQEVRMTTASFPPSDGFTTGAIMNVTLRSGTNAFHGNALYFVQNPKLDSNDFFSNLAGLPRLGTRQNRYGVNGTGPVVIPKVYDGHNRTFWMYTFEELRTGDPRGTITTSVPQPGQITGDFSGLLKLGAQYQIYNPFTTTPAANGRFTRQPFPGNILPPSLLNPAARKLAALWPAPNLQGRPDGQNNWTTPGPEWTNYYTNLFRVDHNFSEANRFYVRGNWSDHKQQYNVRDGGANGAYYHRNTWGMAIDDVHVFSPGFVLNNRAGFTYYTILTEPLQTSFDLAALGFSKGYIDGIRSFDPRGLKLPQMTFVNLDSFSNDVWSYVAPLVLDQTSNATWTVSRHTMRFGEQFRQFRNNTTSLGQASGTMSFGTTYTRGPADNSAAANMGQDLASFLLGLPSGGSIPVNDSLSDRSAILALYFGDDWKATSRLTVNLGLRYELELPTSERYNRTVMGFDAAAQSPIAVQARVNYTANPIPQILPAAFQVNGGLTFAGVNGQPTTLFDSNKKNFEPRIGFAYSPDKRTVFRAGYGIMHDLLGTSARQVVQTGFSTTTTLNPTLDGGLTYIASLTNPFPNGFSRTDRSKLGLATNLGQSVSFFNRSLRNPYAQRWQVGVQRQLFHQTVFEVNYIGNRGTDLLISRNLDATPSQYLSKLPYRDSATLNLLSANVANPFFPLLPGTSLASSTTTVAQLLRPYPQFTGVNVDTNQGYSWYHSLQAQLSKRFAAGFSLQAAFTYSKFMQATAYLNATDPRPVRGISNLDQPLRLVATGIYELPFGPGKRWASRAPGAARNAIGGWQVQGIFMDQSGAPLGFGNAILLGSVKDVPLPADQRSIYRWFNTSAFETNVAKQLSNNIQTLSPLFSGVRAPGIVKFDLAAIKNTRFGEKRYVQFRAEFVNAFNHAMFSAPNTNPSNTAFGTITSVRTARTIQFGIKVHY